MAFSRRTCLSVGSWARCRRTTDAIKHAWVINAYANAPLRLANMSATILDVWASASAPGSSGRCIGRS
eukprot:6551990-Pyramimonas_sp.AAC.1